MFERKVCTECGQEKDVWEFYDKYARCKQCTREDQNATNWYKPVALLPYEEWPSALQAYVETRREYVSQGRSVPAITKEMILAYNLSQGEDPDVPTEVSLPVIVAMHKQLVALTARVEELSTLLDNGPASTEHERRTMLGEMANLLRKCCREVDDLVKEDKLDPLDAAEIKEGVRLINEAIVHDMPVPAKAVLDSVLNLAQLQLSLPASLDALYTKFYKPHLPSAAEADVQRVIDIAGVNLYEVDWVEFLQGE